MMSSLTKLHTLAASPKPVDFGEVRTIAVKARKQIVAFSKSMDRGIEWDHWLYREIHLHFPTRSRNLMGWCAITSAFLQKKLSLHRIKSTLVVGHYHNSGHHRPYSKEDLRSWDNHTWLQVDDQIVDATANQFSKSLPQILIVPADDSRYQARYYGKDALRVLRTYWQKEESPVGDGEVDKIKQIMYHETVPKDWKAKPLQRKKV